MLHPITVGDAMQNPYILEITKAGEHGGDAVNIRLPLDEERIGAVIAAATGLPVPRVQKVKTPKAAKVTKPATTTRSGD